MGPFQTTLPKTPPQGNPASWVYSLTLGVKSITLRSYALLKLDKHAFVCPRKIVSKLRSVPQISTLLSKKVIIEVM